jgi:benzoyl-CoA 2,3-dioxygenase component B
MTAVSEPSRMAGWLAPPATGVNTKPVDFEYVKG